MRLIKEKIKFTGNDITIPLSLSTNSNFNGLQQSINDFIEEETGLSINPVEDADTFRYIPESAYTYNFNFISGSTTGSSYQIAGFNTNEISRRSEVISRSFFIIQLYDSPNVENQTLLHNGYLNGYVFVTPNRDGNLTNAEYTLNDTTEFTNFYIPNWYIDSLSGITTTLYGKLSFYNAKTGKLDLFFNSNNNPPEVDEDLYVEFQINPTGKTYTANTTMNFIEFTNDQFIDKINNSLSSFTNKKPTYPDGLQFLNTGKYE